MAIILFVSIEIILFVLLWYACKQLSNYTKPTNLCEWYEKFIRGTID